VPARGATVEEVRPFFTIEVRLNNGPFLSLCKWDTHDNAISRLAKLKEEIDALSRD